MTAFIFIISEILIILVTIFFFIARRGWLEGNSKLAPWLTVSVALLAIIAAFYIGIRQNSISTQLVAIERLRDRPTFITGIIEGKNDILNLSENRDKLEVEIILENIGDSAGKLGALEAKICFGVAEAEQGKKQGDCIPVERAEITSITSVFFPNNKDSVILSIYSFNEIEGVAINNNIITQGEKPAARIDYTVSYYALGDVDKENVYTTTERISMGKGWVNFKFDHLDAT